MEKVNLKIVDKSYLLHLPGKTKLVPLQTIVGSLLVIAGTLLPWITVFGGLHSYSGITGLNGRLLLGAGIVSFFVGIFLWVRSPRYISWIMGLYGFILLAFSAWLLIGLWKTYQAISQDSMIIGGIGPGLFVTTVGAFLIFSSMFTGWEKRNKLEKKNHRALGNMAITTLILLAILGGSFYMIKSGGITQASSLHQQNDTIATDAASQSCAPTGQTHTILIEGNKFIPDELTVNRCDTVSFKNGDQNTPYLPAFGEHPNHIYYPGFTEKTLDYNQENTFIAQKKGEFMFHDHLQDEAAGILTVK